MFQRFKNFRKLRKWYVVKLKLVDARLYFVSIFVGLLTGVGGCSLSLLPILFL